MAMVATAVEMMITQEDGVKGRTKKFKSVCGLIYCKYRI